MNIETKNSDEKELRVKKVLEDILFKYPCPIFTNDIVIDSNSIPHSHSILTLNTRNTNPILVLATFVHEQFHWFTQIKSSFKDCIVYLKKYKELEDFTNNPDKYPNSFWIHLIVCWNTRNFLQKNITKEQVDFIYSQWQPYPITEKFVKENFDTLKNDLNKFGMIYYSDSE